MAIEANALRPQARLFICTFCQRSLFYHTAFVWIMTGSTINLAGAWLQRQVNIIFFRHPAQMFKNLATWYNQVVWWFFVA